MDSTLCFIILGVTVVIIFIIAKSQVDRMNAAKAAYHAALERLKKDPTNSDLRQETLSLGRAYSSLTRNSKGVTLFDEVALMNDINAATGGSFAAASPQVYADPTGTPTSSAPTIQERLARLDELRASGTLTEEEFQSRRNKILDEL